MTTNNLSHSKPACSSIVEGHFHELVNFPMCSLANNKSHNKKNVKHLISLINCDMPYLRS